MGRCLNHVNHYRPGYCRLAGSEIRGQTVFSRLSDIPVHIDMVDVLRQPHYLAGRHCRTGD